MNVEFRIDDLGFGRDCLAFPKSAPRAENPTSYILNSTSDRRPRTTAHRPLVAARPAFTLVELLVTITIMSILAAIALFALAGVEESANRDKTIATIRKLNALVMAKYESYRTRRVPITIPAGSTTLTAATLRVDAIRELMRMEMPDRYTDIQDAPVKLPTRPAASQAYFNFYSSHSPIIAYESAKCLYLFVSLGLDDPDVMSLFNDDEISIDTRDGLRYFVDGWGQPIFFIRWAPGFSSPLHPWNVNSKDAIGNSIAISYPTTHDPFDQMHVYRPSSGEPFYNPALPITSQIYPPLYPLIYSAGPDRIFDIFVNDKSTTPSATSNEFQYSTTSPPNNPYAIVNGGLFGTPTDQDSDFTPTGVTQGDGVDNSIDNITNHDLSQN
jgi:prepilin-type N-terminal cleavage/methylation domain-containing protein